MSFSRRKFLALSSTALLSQAALGKTDLNKLPAERQLKLLNLHTGERLNTCYWEQGQYHVDAMAELNHFFRDHRNDQIAGMDPLLLDSIHQLNEHLDYHGEIHIISGYRSPETNEKLRQQGRKVAKRSFHLQGRAIDFRLPGADLSEVRKAALGLHRGGVGYYPKSNFLHLDTGRQRQWG
jgi:uncharacterized protein YcbK (DUF882 family)